MGVAVRGRATVGRSRASFGEPAGSPSIDPSAAEFADSKPGLAGCCPEIDCVRSLLASNVIDAVERRAAALGVGADRVLITAGELSEEVYLTSAFLGWLGLSRRGLLSTAWVLLLTPAHWLLLSLAAWRALYQFVTAPYRWEKTEHGLAKSSRRAAKLVHSLLELERYLTALKEAGDLPGLANDATGRAVARRPHSRVAA